MAQRAPGWFNKGLLLPLAALAGELMTDERDRIEAVGLLLEEGERRVRLAIESGEPEDGQAGVTLVQAAMILLGDAELDLKV